MKSTVLVRWMMMIQCVRVFFFFFGGVSRSSSSLSIVVVNRRRQSSSSIAVVVLSQVVVELRNELKKLCTRFLELPTLSEGVRVRSWALLLFVVVGGWWRRRRRWFLLSLFSLLLTKIRGLIPCVYILHKKKGMQIQYNTCTILVLLHYFF